MLKYDEISGVNGTIKAAVKKYAMKANHSKMNIKRMFQSSASFNVGLFNLFARLNASQLAYKRSVCVCSALRRELT